MTEEQLKRFFNNECSAGEADEVLAFLKKNPSAVEKFLPFSEWQEIVNQPLPEEQWREIWNQLQQKRKPVYKTRWIKRLAAAAAVLIASLVIYEWWQGSQDEFADTQSSAVQQLPAITRVLNSSDTTQMIVLPDNSYVLLAPGSVISRNDEYNQQRRDLQLHGHARFRVAKDSSRPFTVYSGPLQTTALGTEFSVNTLDAGEQLITVKLYSGKVVVRRRDSTQHTWKQDIFLAPGQQLAYELHNLTATITEFSAENAKAAASSRQRKQPASEPAQHTNALVFNSSALDDVFTRLEHHFQRNIEFDPSEVTGLNFTGTISANDSLEVVLKVIAQMNGLQLLAEGEDFRLSKQ